MCGRAVDLLRAGDARALGALMVEAQARFDRDMQPACPEQLTMPLLHALLGHGPLQPLVWGGKGVGSQGDGSAQLLCRSKAAQRAVLELVPKARARERRERERENGPSPTVPRRPERIPSL